MPETIKNYYETLGIPRSASDEQIKTAYRKLILKFHPDKNVGDTFFEDWSKKVIEAFEVLGDREARAQYDYLYKQHEMVVIQPEVVHTNGEAATSNQEELEALILQQVKEQLPQYLSVKQSYFKAVWAKRQPEKKATTTPQSSRTLQIILCLLLIIASAGWIANNQLKNNEQPESLAFENISTKLEVISNQAFFYQNPQRPVKTNDFLLKGYKLTTSRKYGDFYYVEFASRYNPNYILKGWLKASDIKLLP